MRDYTASFDAELLLLLLMQGGGGGRRSEGKAAAAAAAAAPSCAPAAAAAAPSCAPAAAAADAVLGTNPVLRTSPILRTNPVAWVNSIAESNFGGVYAAPTSPGATSPTLRAPLAAALAGRTPDEEEARRAVCAAWHKSVCAMVKLHERHREWMEQAGLLTAECTEYASMLAALDLERYTSLAAALEARLDEQRARGERRGERRVPEPYVMQLSLGEIKALAGMAEGGGRV